MIVICDSSSVTYSVLDWLLKIAVRFPPLPCVNLGFQTFLHSVLRNGVRQTMKCVPAANPDNVTYHWYLPADQTRRWSTLQTKLLLIGWRYVAYRSIWNITLPGVMYMIIVIISRLLSLHHSAATWEHRHRAWSWIWSPYFDMGQLGRIIHEAGEAEGSGPGPW